MLKRIRLFSYWLTIMALCSASLTAQSDWYHITSPGSLSTVFFVDSLLGWVGGGSGIFKTTDGGITWASQTLPIAVNINRIVFLTSNIGFAVGSNGTILKTTNAGVSWIQKPSNIQRDLQSIFFIDDQHGWSCGRDTVLLSTDQGETWSTRSVPTSSVPIIVLWDICFRTSQEGWTVGLYGGCYKSTNGGDSWSSVNAPISGMSLFGVCFPTSSRGIMIVGDQIALSTDAGNSWNSVYSGGGTQLNSVSFPDSLNGWVVGTDKIIKTTNGGSTWHEQSWPSPTGYLTAVHSSDKQHAWAIGDGIILKTTNGGEETTVVVVDSSLTHWTKLNFDSTEYPTVQCFCVKGSNLYMGTYFRGVFLSSDDGASWIQMNKGLLDSNINSIVVNGSNIFAGCESGAYRSTDNGLNWDLKLSPVDYGSNRNRIGSLVVSGVHIYAAPNLGILLSTDNGINWKPVNNGFPEYMNAYSFLSNGEFLFASTFDGVFRLTIPDTSWSIANTGLPSPVYSFASYSTNIYASTNYEIFLSTNSGSSWISISSELKKHYIFCITQNGENLFAGTLDGVFLSTNHGVNWKSLGGPFCNSLAITNKYIFAGTTSGVWRRSLAEVLQVGVKSNDLPTRFKLEQNYPNPFNPSTTIKYSLSKATHVILKIYNILGQEVALLVSKNLIAGTYAFEWNASGFASGVYYYRIETDNSVETKKLILLK